MLGKKFVNALIIAALTYSLGAWSLIDDRVLAQNESTIPRLPPKEPAAPAFVDAKEGEDDDFVINYDPSQVSTGFFDGFTHGISRYANALELNGYLRFRFNYFRNPSLGTYIPELMRGTSNFPPNLRSLVKNADGETSLDNPAQNNFSGNMRFRLNPTINVSEVVRIKGTIDFFDNLVLGSTSSSMAQPRASLVNRSSLMALSQNPPAKAAISVKRFWGEASFPVGELKFGRMPQHWGLGIVYNSGDAISGDLGDQIDGVQFTTQLFDHFVTPGYSISYSGPSGRGGGLSFGDMDFQSYRLAADSGQLYPLVPSSLTHVFSLSILKKTSDFMANKWREEGLANIDYGLFASYRRQYLDSQSGGLAGEGLVENLVVRDGHVGLLSLWSAFSLSTFHLEIEAAGIWGGYQVGEKKSDLLAENKDKNEIKKERMGLLQGGIAMESKIGFLDDRLQVGIDGGWASHRSKSMRKDGRYETGFAFNPSYDVDLLLHKEILGGIFGTAYVKPHVAYFFSRNLGVRGDAIASFAPDKSSTSGNSSWLGLEVDASAFIRSENGFYFQLSYGILFPGSGLDHRKTEEITPTQLEIFGSAKVAQTLQAHLGIAF